MTVRYPPLIYVAGAYAGDVEANISKAEAVSIELIRNGWHVFTPHKNTSGYEQYEDERITRETWLEMDINTLSRCDALYVMNNWRTSPGTKGEIEYAESMRIPIYYEEDHPSDDLGVWT